MQTLTFTDFPDVLVSDVEEPKTWYDHLTGEVINQTVSSWGSISTKYGDSGRVVISSNDTEGYHERLAKGELIPYTGLHVLSESLKQRLVTGNGVYDQWSSGAFPYRVVTSNLVGPMAGVNDGSASFPEMELSSFNPLLLEAMGEAQTGALLVLLEMAESRKVVDLIFNFRKRFVERANHIREFVLTKKSPRTTKQFHQAFSNTWLEWRYGWRQLFYAAEDVVSALDILAKEPFFKVAQGRGFESTSKSATAMDYQLTGPSPQGNPTFASLTGTVTLEQRAAVSLQISKVLSALDYNVVGLGWELVPFSFVVDWFVNIGDLARVAWPVPTLAETKCTSVKKIHEVNAVTSVVPYSGYPPAIDGYMRHIRNEYKRIPHEGEIPWELKWNRNSGLEKILDVISLTVSGSKTLYQSPFRV